MRKSVEALTCELTEAELNAKGQLLSAAMLEYDEKEDLKKDTVKELSDELKLIRGRMKTLSTTIRERSETRSVDCTIQFHSPEPGMKRIVRDDTGEIVRDEQMTMQERQNNLFDDVAELNRLYRPDDKPEDGQ